MQGDVTPTGVHIFTSELEQLKLQLEDWFRERNDVTLIDYGSSEIGQVGFIVLRFDGDVDTLLMPLLRVVPSVIDVCPYKWPLLPSY